MPLLNLKSVKEVFNILHYIKEPFIIAGGLSSKL